MQIHPALRQPAVLLTAAALLGAGVTGVYSLAREPRPVPARGGAVLGQFGQLRADLLERETDTLGVDDERDASEDRARVAAVRRPSPMLMPVASFSTA